MQRNRCAVAGLKRRTRVATVAQQALRRSRSACKGYMCSGSRGRGNEAEECGGMHRRSKPLAVSRRDRQHHRRAACNRNAAHWSAVQRWGNARLPGSPKPQASIAFSSRGTAVQYQCGNRRCLSRASAGYICGARTHSRSCSTVLMHRRPCGLTALRYGLHILPSLCGRVHCDSQ